MLQHPTIPSRLRLSMTFKCLQESQGCPVFNVACDSGSKGIVSAIYCISFIFGVNFVMLNLVIAVIIDQFVESAGREGLFLDNTLFEILHKKMLLDRFLKRLRTKVKLCPCLPSFSWLRYTGGGGQGLKRGEGSAVLVRCCEKQQCQCFDNAFAELVRSTDLKGKQQAVNRITCSTTLCCQP